ncbi:basic leucine zipper 63-like [Zingiber officinale]|uniref:basic leucine zipper 63-like n=1 Tax=Zingiber officinale TaxID=94328 RepID=UPI001C4CAE14|nr:basic leucine zipper 63-like [Zingiber officinale]
MERAFSLEEFNDCFWASSPLPTPSGIPLQAGEGGVGGEDGGINRSASEWCFEKFFLDVFDGGNANPASASAHDPNLNVSRNYDSILAPNSGASSSLEAANVCGSKGELGRVGHHELGEMKAPVAPQSSNPVELVDPGEYQALLKKKLDIICAAVAMSRGSGVKIQDSASVADSRSPISDVTPPGSQLHSKVTQGRQAASNSSGEQSDEDDDLEGEVETNNMDPSDTKRMRRMISNRESARRSRRRKQTQMSELEEQVSQLRVEHSSLLNHLTGINKKYSDASVDNRILKADLETLRAKVKMAEESLKRATGANPLYPVISEMPSIGLPFSPNTANPTSNMVLPFQEGINHFFQAPMHVQDVPHGVVAAPATQIGLITSMQQQAPSPEDQKPICSGPISCSPLQWNTTVWSPEASISDK